MPRNEIRLQAGILQPDQREQVRAACRTPRELAMVEVLMTCRRAEAAALRWEDLDLTSGLVRIQRGKGGHPDWTLLPARTREALRALSEQPRSSPWVFPAPGACGARPYTANGLAKVVRGVLQRAGCWSPGLGACHRFRRTFATEYLRQHPGDVCGLQRLMRHRSVKTTAGYVFLQPQDLAPRLAQVAL